jgi:hypothetical protein
MWILSTNFILFKVVNAALSAIMIGINIETMTFADPPTRKMHYPYVVADGFLWLLFAGELYVRINHHRGDFFKERNFAGSAIGNFYDCFCIVCWFVELITESIEDNGVSLHLTLMRSLRIVRFLVVLRRNSKHGPLILHKFVTSALTSFQAFFYAALVIFVILYLFAAFFAQVVHNHRVEKIEVQGSTTTTTAGIGCPNVPTDLLLEYWGSVSKSCLSFFQAISGGNDWAVLHDPLKEQIDIKMGFAFQGYIAFVQYALLNVITGIFVENAVGNAKKDKQDEMASLVRHFLKIVSGEHEGNEGVITYEEYRNHLESPWMQQYFEYIDVDPSDAEFLFQLLDIDGNGEVGADEFLNGCMRCSGSARSLDLRQLTHEYRKNTRKSMAMHKSLEKKLDKIQKKED